MVRVLLLILAILALVAILVGLFALGVVVVRRAFGPPDDSRR